jgi:hypothetical protein
MCSIFPITSVLVKNTFQKMAFLLSSSKILNLNVGSIRLSQPLSSEMWSAWSNGPNRGFIRLPHGTGSTNIQKKSSKMKPYKRKIHNNRLSHKPLHFSDTFYFGIFSFMKYVTLQQGTPWWQWYPHFIRKLVNSYLVLKICVLCNKTEEAGRFISCQFCDCCW